jgi:hypothetical protein
LDLENKPKIETGAFIMDLTKQDVITRGIREGWITPARKSGTGPLPRKPVTTFEELMKDLDESREDSARS